MTDTRTTEEKLTVALRTTLASAGSPILDVVEGTGELIGLPPGTVALFPLEEPREPSTVSQQRWHLTVQVGLVTLTVAPTAATETELARSALADVFTLAAAVLNCIEGATMMTALRAAGGFKYQRTRLRYFCEPGFKVGARAGALFEVILDFNR